MAIWPTPRWPASREVLPPSCPRLPATWSPMAAALTGVHRSQPTLATAPVREAESAWEAAGLSATALASVPPNHAARPTSCSERDRVLRGMGPPIEQRAGLAPYPSLPGDRQDS